MAEPECCYCAAGMGQHGAAPSSVPTALDFPGCRACQMWKDAGASWPRPCKQHYGGEPDESPQAVTYQEAILDGANPYE